MNAKGRPMIAGKFLTTSPVKTGSKRLTQAAMIKVAVAARAAAQYLR
jgi:hypothetical protein